MQAKSWINLIAGAMLILAGAAAFAGEPLSSAPVPACAVREMARLGVKPKEVMVLEPGALPRATHKAKRLIDLR